MASRTLASALSADQVARTWFGKNPTATFEPIIGGKFVIVRYETAGKLHAAQVKASTSARAMFKTVFHYTFRSEEARERHIANAIACEQSTVDHRAARAEVERIKNDAFVQPYKVGDILNNSWGYDQTNVGFYEVVGLFGKRGVLLRELAQEEVEGSQGFMCERVKPRPGVYCQEFVRYDEESNQRIYRDKEPMRRQVGNDGYVNIYGADYGRAHRWDGQPEYQSHYA